MRKILFLLIALFSLQGYSQTFYQLYIYKDIETVDYGNTANWLQGYNHSVKSLIYAGNQLALEREDGSILSVTIEGGGGDYVPIAGNIENPMTGALYLDTINFNGPILRATSGNRLVTSDEFYAGGNIYSEGFGDASLWKSAYDNNIVSMSFDEPTNTLTLLKRNSTFVSTTIPVGGGDFVPISGNEGNPMTGSLVVKNIQGSSDFSPIVYGKNANPNLSLGNITVGNQAGEELLSSAEWNTLIGNQAGFSITTGSRNVVIGKGAGTSINTGSRNFMLGESAGQSITSGSQNIMIGSNAGFSATGDDWVYVGNSSSLGNTSVLYGKSTDDIANNYIVVNGDMYVKQWQIKQTAQGLSFYKDGVFKMRISTTGDLFIGGDKVHYNATE